MKGAAYLMFALLFVAAIPVLVRCDGTILNDQFTIEADSPSFNNHIVDLKSGDTISIKLNVSQGMINFKIMDPNAHFLLDREGIGTGG